MPALVTIVAVALLLLYVWLAFGFSRANGQSRLQLLSMLTIWSGLAGLASLLFVLGALNGFGIFSTIGAAFALATPVLWGLGRVGPRLTQYGLSWSKILFG
jgi:hypothetical protein